MNTVLRTMKNWAHGHTVNNSKSRFGGIFTKKSITKNSSKKVFCAVLRTLKITFAPK